MSNDEQTSVTPKKQRKIVTVRRQQKFRSAWQNEGDFCKWLVADPVDIYKAKCKLCNASFTADIKVIRTHSKSKAHIVKTPSSSQKGLEKFLAPAEGDKEHSTLAKSVKRAEIKMSGFMVEHNISFDTMNHLCDLLKDCFPDSEIAQNFQMKATKCKAVIKNVIAATQKEILAAKLKTNLFSIMVDEATDISATKTLCVVVRCKT